MSETDTTPGGDVDVDENPCLDCGGMCCSFKAMRISYRGLEKGERYDSALLEDSATQLLRSDGSVPDMDFYVGRDPAGNRHIYFECNHLQEDGRCGIYEDRPEMCRTFECAVLTGDQSLEDFQEENRRPDGELEELELREVTDRVRDILERTTLPEAEDGETDE